MKRMFLVVMLAVAAFCSVSAEDQTLGEVVSQFRKAVNAQDFAALRQLVAPNSIPVLDRIEKEIQEEVQATSLKEKGNLAVAQVSFSYMPELLIPGNRLFLRKIDGKWKVELAEVADQKAYQNVDAVLVCVTNLKQIGIGLIMFYDDYKKLPAEDGAAGLAQVQNYFLPHSAVFVCPADGERTAAPSKTSITENNCSYLYFGGIDLIKLRRPSRMPLAFDKPGISHDGVTDILFADGHVEQWKGDYKNVAGLVEAIIARGGLDDQAESLRKKAAEADRRLQEEKK